MEKLKTLRNYNLILLSIFTEYWEATTVIKHKYEKQAICQQNNQRKFIAWKIKTKLKI